MHTVIWQNSLTDAIQQLYALTGRLRPALDEITVKRS